MENLTIKINPKSKAFIREYAKSRKMTVSEIMDEILESFIKKERINIRREKRLNQTKQDYEQQVNTFLTGLFNSAQR